MCVYVYIYIYIYIYIYAIVVCAIVVFGCCYCWMLHAHRTERTEKTERNKQTNRQYQLATNGPPIGQMCKRCTWSKDLRNWDLSIMQTMIMVQLLVKSCVTVPICVLWTWPGAMRGKNMTLCFAFPSETWRTTFCLAPGAC